MPQVNLSAVTGQELRQLLDSSRRRGDAALTYKILQEMAARRETATERRPFKMRRATESRPVPVELGEPAEAEEDDLPPLPTWRPPARDAEGSASSPPEPAAAPAPAVDVEPPSPPLETVRPLSLHDTDPEPLWDAAEDPAADLVDRDLQLHPPERGSAHAPRRPRPRLGAGFALGVPLGAAVGLALGWWAGGVARDVLSPLAPPPAPIRTAAMEPRPAPAPATAADSAPEALPTPATEPPPSNAEQPAPGADSAAADPSTASPAPRIAEAETDGVAEIAQPTPERSARVAAGGCAAESTPADRAICGDPALRRLQRQLQQAYAEALEAHEDRTLLRERQLAWRDARNTVTDPERLTRLYEERIRKLNAATAEARQGR